MDPIQGQNHDFVIEGSTIWGDAGKGTHCGEGCGHEITKEAISISRVPL